MSRTEEQNLAKMLPKGVWARLRRKRNSFSRSQRRFLHFCRAFHFSRVLAKEVTSCPEKKQRALLGLPLKGTEQISSVVALQEKNRIAMSCEETISHYTPA